jgi:hypothetical protein
MSLYFHTNLTPRLITATPLTRISANSLHAGQVLSTVRVRLAFSFDVRVGSRVTLRVAENVVEKKGKKKNAIGEHLYKFELCLTQVRCQLVLYHHSTAYHAVM